MNFDSEGVCDACNQAFIKTSINWKDKKKITSIIGQISW